MKIAVCDDNKLFLQELEQMLNQISFVQEISCFNKIDDFFTSIQDREHYDLVIMDLDWTGEAESGLDFAERLCQLAPHLPVLCVTGYNDRFAPRVLLRELNLTGYLTKPVDPALLEQYLNKVLLRSQKKENLTFFSQGSLFSLDIRKIMYIESRNHITVIHTASEAYQAREKLSDFMPRLAGAFIQCHKSYAVNMSWIQRMDPGQLLLRSGAKIPISRSRTQQTRENVFAFMGLQI